MAERILNGGSGSVLNVAIIGVGEVAMTTHLPTLLLCSHMYSTVAIVDVSRDALDHCARKFHIPKTFTDVGEMLEACPEVDLVMIMNANEYHVIHAVQCLQAGRHVFIEKPVALSIPGAEQIQKAQDASGKVVFVGYMRRYSQAFLRVKEAIQGLPKESINYVHVRDIIGGNPLFVDQSATFPLKFNDYPRATADERNKISSEIHAEALGRELSANKEAIASWGLLNGLGTHDLSALRELFGMPQRVLSAAKSSHSAFHWALLQYDGFVVMYETGVDNVRSFDAHIEIFSKETRIKLQYDTPYVKGLPITATFLYSKQNGDHVEEIVRPTYEDTYTLEYREMYDCIVNGATVKTTVQDACNDLELLTMIMRAIFPDQ